MNHPPGAVVVFCQETARYHRFTISLANLELPAGSHRIFAIGTSIIDNLNSALRRLRSRDEWVWLVGDDHVFKPDTLLRLLDRQTDMVAPLCARRGPPFPLVHYREPLDAGSRFHHVIQYDELPDTNDLFEVQVTGSLPLIRRHLLDQVGDPWFTNSNGLLNEEFGFCAKVRGAGYQVLVDPAVQVGHIGEIVVWPCRGADGWGLAIDFVGADGQQVFYPGGMYEPVPA